MRFTLVITDAVMAKDVLDTVADLCSRIIGQYHIHSTSVSNFICKSVDELPVTPLWINTHEIASSSDEELSTCTSPLSYEVEEDRITTNNFMTAIYIRSRKMGPNMISNAVDRRKMWIIPSSRIEGVLNHFTGCIKEELTVAFKISRKFTVFSKVHMIIHCTLPVFRNLMIKWTCDGRMELDVTCKSNEIITDGNKSSYCRRSP